MLRFATITLSNPKRPDLPPVISQAVITTEDFRLAITPEIVSALQLEKIGEHEVREADATEPAFLTYVGPIHVMHGSREGFTGALCGAGVVIGAALASELKLETVAIANPQVANDSYVPHINPSWKKETTAGSAGRIMQVENAIDLEACREICAYARSNPHSPLGVISMKTDIDKDMEILMVKDMRDSLSVQITDAMRSKLERMLHKLFITHIEPFFGVRTEWWEHPQLLYYPPGGKYMLHTDADRWVATPDGKGQWEPSIDRDISILLYLNDDFIGGKLHFPGQQLKITPKPGLLVAFPSSSKYAHEAQPTESGERFVLVTWVATRGKVRVSKKPTQCVTFIESFCESA